MVKGLETFRKVKVLSNQLGYVARDEHLHGFDAGKHITINP